MSSAFDDLYKKRWCGPPARSRGMEETRRHLPAIRVGGCLQRTKLVSVPGAKLSPGQLMLEECAPQGGPEPPGQGVGRTTPKWHGGPPDGPGSVRPKVGSGPDFQGPTTPPGPSPSAQRTASKPFLSLKGGPPGAARTRPPAQTSSLRRVQGRVG